MRTRFCDIAVIGGGPAGAMAAIGALRADPSLHVAVLEPNDPPAPRIGEAVLAGTVMAMHDAGLSASLARQGFHRKIGAAYVWGESREPWYVNYPDTGGDYPEEFSHPGGRYAIHVPRPEFDSWLLGEARVAGCEVVKARASDLSAREDASGRPEAVSCGLSDGTRLAARRWIDASGQGSFLGRRLTARLPIGSPRVARWAYAPDVDWGRAEAAGFHPNRTNILSGANGWMWAIHLGERGGGLTSIGFVSTAEAFEGMGFGDASERFPETSAFLPNGFRDPRDALGNPMHDWNRHPDYSWRCRELDGPNWALAGDAGLFLDPILSQGATLAVHYGMLRGRAAAAEIAGAEGAQSEVSRHYGNECRVLAEVVGQWYSNNRSAGDWRLKAVGLALESKGLEMDPEGAFRYMTNLENLRGEYDPYPASEKATIDRMLGTDRNA